MHPDFTAPKLNWVPFFFDNVNSYYNCYLNLENFAQTKKESKYKFKISQRNAMNHKYQVKCTLTFGDIYLQIIIWLIVIFVSLASALALWSTVRQIYALATVGLILVLSLPFLLFAFVTTLLNHIEISPIDPPREIDSET